MNGHIVSSEPTSSTTSNQNHTSVPIPTVPVVPEEEEEKAITASTESASEPGAVIEPLLDIDENLEPKHASRRRGDGVRGVFRCLLCFSRKQRLYFFFVIFLFYH